MAAKTKLCHTPAEKIFNRRQAPNSSSSEVDKLTNAAGKHHKTRTNPQFSNGIPMIKNLNRIDYNFQLNKMPQILYVYHHMN